MHDSPDTTNDSMEQLLWNCYSIAVDNDRKNVEAKILDKILGQKLANNYQTVQRLLSEMFDETTLEVEDLVDEKWQYQDNAGIR